MPDSTKVAKAVLLEIDPGFDHETNAERKVTVQFNPETLKVAFTNTIVKPGGGGDQSGTPSMQYVGSGSTRLTLQIWFDLTVPDADNAITDVRQYTEKVLYFMTPAQKQVQSAEGKETTIFIPPAVRFLWGSFQFDGIMDSLTESLEFFSSEGIPLRASMDLSISQQKIQQVVRAISFAGGMSSVGTSPLTLIKSGATLQGIADSIGGNWRSIAAANQISNPRLPTPGKLISLGRKLF